MTVSIANMTSQWANSSTIFTGIGMNVNASSYSASSRVMDLKMSGNSVFYITPSGTANDSKGDVRDIPVVTKSSNYTAVLTDVGKIISVSSGGVNIPSNVFSPGHSFAIYNNSTGSQTIYQNAGAILYLVGTGSTGNRTLLQRGLVTIMCVGTNTFVASGGGLT